MRPSAGEEPYLPPGLPIQGGQAEGSAPLCLSFPFCTLEGAEGVEGCNTASFYVLSGSLLMFPARPTLPLPEPPWPRYVRTHSSSFTAPCEAGLKQRLLTPLGGLCLHPMPSPMPGPRGRELHGPRGTL